MALSNISTEEKNSLVSDSVWLVMLEIHIPSVTEVIRIVNNNENIDWNGETWQRFPFELEEISDNANAETSQFQIKVSNVSSVIGQYIRQYDAYIKSTSFEPITVVLYIVNSKDLTNPEPVFSTDLVLSTSKMNSLEVTFTVSAKDLFSARTPQYRMFPNSCRFTFKDSMCQYAGTEGTCDKSLGRCRELQNSERYGGFPTIDNQGVSV